MAQDHYECLGVDPAATREEIRDAYRALARELHPDRSGASEAMAEVNEAWRVLGDEDRRGEYDASIRSSPAPPARPGSVRQDGRAEAWAERRPPTERSLGRITIEDPNEVRLHRLIVGFALFAGVVVAVLLVIALTTSPSGS